ncbi:MAG: FAD-dependent oxidoreductase [Opitutae bacterium]
MKILVLGAGMSGCSCAQALVHSGHQVTLVEKGRGVGGRMATRRMDGARIDHGAQFFTTRDPRLQAMNRVWLQEERVTEWYGHVPGRPDIPSDMRYRGQHGMTGPVKSLSLHCSLALNFFVEKIEKNKVWKVWERAGEGRILQADHLVMTMPPMQMLELFSRSDIGLESDTMTRLNDMRHTQCLAILGILDRSSRLACPGAVAHPAEHIDWLCDNQIKGISARPAITLHASAEFSCRYWDVPAKEWAHQLVGPAEELLGANVSKWVSHRWGFAKPLVTFGASHHHIPELCLTLAGDGFGGERVEGAAISGLEAADSILRKNF